MSMAGGGAMVGHGLGGGVESWPVGHSLPTPELCNTSWGTKHIYKWSINPFNGHIAEHLLYNRLCLASRCEATLSTHTILLFVPVAVGWRWGGFGFI